MDNWVQWGITTLLTGLGLLAGRYWGKNDRKVVHDKEILNKILETMPSIGSILFIRHHDFGGSFDRDKLDDIRNFFGLSLRPEYLFLDDTLEKLRKQLIEDIEAFLDFLGTNTYPIRDRPRFSQIKPAYEYKNHDEYLEIYDGIHKLADKVCQSYDNLIIKAIRKL